MKNVNGIWQKRKSKKRRDSANWKNRNQNPVMILNNHLNQQIQIIRDKLLQFIKKSNTNLSTHDLNKDITKQSLILNFSK